LALAGGRAGHRRRRHAEPALAALARGAGVAVVAADPVGERQVGRAGAVGRGADALRRARPRGRADHPAAADAVAALADVAQRAGVLVVAREAVVDRRVVAAAAGRRVADALDLALERRRAHHRIRAGAGAGDAAVGLRA